MQCAQCETRSAIGYCGTCRTLLCEVCGAACQGCGKGMCRAHRARTAEGRWLCPACHAAHEARRIAGAPGGPPRAHPPSPAPPPAAPPVSAAPSGGGSTSFSDLMSDIAPVEVAAPPPPTPSAGPLTRPLVATDDDGDRKPSLDEIEARAMALLEKSMEEERHNARVLTGSASRGTPMWLSGAFLGGLGCVLLLLQKDGTAIWDAVRYVVLLVGLGAVVWNGYGFYNREQPPKSRNLCLIGLALGIATVGITLFRWGG